MIVKGRALVMCIEPAEFPKPRQGEKPYDEVTYFDRQSRDKDNVTLLIDRQVPTDSYPREMEEAVLVLSVEQVSRVVKRQDRDDPGRTYDSASKQFRARVVAFEPVSAAANGVGDAAKGKPPAVKAA
jgi:hypothetical protein